MANRRLQHPHAADERRSLCLLLLLLIHVPRPLVQAGGRKPIKSNCFQHRRHLHPFPFSGVSFSIFPIRHLIVFSQDFFFPDLFDKYANNKNQKCRHRFNLCCICIFIYTHTVPIILSRPHRLIGKSLLPPFKALIAGVFE